MSLQKAVITVKSKNYVDSLNGKSASELKEELTAAKKELFNLRFQNATNQLDNTRRVIVEERNLRKTRVGHVVSDKMDKTIVVAVEDHVRHPLYKKIVQKTYKLKAHDENNEAHVGDTVRVMETRPLSKDKRWRLVDIVEKAK